MSILGVLFLSSDELRDLTDLKIAKAQMRWLDKYNYPYEISASGKPKVLREYVMKRLLTISLSTIPTNEPNFDAIR
jgi:hypothetical protein